MTGCKNCSSSCFEIIFDKCVGYTGESFPGAPDGSSIYDIIQVLKDRIEYLEEKLSGCDNCGSDSTTVELAKTSLAGFSENYSACSSKITNTNVRYTVVPGQNSVSVQFSLEDIINNLPTGYKPTKKELRVYGQSGSNTLYVSTDKTTGSFSLAPSKFPINMDVTIMVGTPCGTVSIEKTLLVNADLNGSYTGNLYIKDYAKESYSDVTQAEYNEAVKNKVLLTERTVETLKTPNVSGTSKVYIKEGSSIEEVLQRVVNEIDSLKQ